MHALEESWRVLRPNGELIDLRPIASDPLVEIVSDRVSKSAGHLDDSRRRAGDLAADEAIDHVVDRGLFEQDGVKQFRFSLYWNSADEMQAYVEERWSNSAEIPSAVLRQAERLTKMAGHPIKARIQRKMHLATYGKKLIDAEPNLVDKT